jgi:hypothetical protein
VKRSQALVGLSRDHHKALTLAQKLRRAEDGPEAAALFRAYWEEHGAVHFRIEEEVLLPSWAQLGEINSEAAARLAREHLAIRIAALELVEQPELDLAHDLGQLLADHVRFEERELFALIEMDLGTSQLEQLAQAVAAAEK